MGRPSISSPTSSNNVRFYSSTVTMGNYNGNSRFCQGPRRVFCFCLLAVITPAFFVSIVLLMRFVFNGTATYHINPSDMRILDHKISTTWCQSETIKMNTTFTAYLTDGEPTLIRAPAPLTTTKTLVIPDDHKEYWGFYLLKGSTFRIRTCARHKGGTLLIVKGRSHLHHCAYIGEADSAGDSDEFSNSASIEDTGNRTANIQNFRQLLASQRGTSTEEMSMILARIRAFIKSRPVGYTKLQEQLSNWMLLDPKFVRNPVPAEENNATGTSQQSNSEVVADGNLHSGHRIRHVNAKLRQEEEKLWEHRDNTRSPHDGGNRVSVLNDGAAAAVLTSVREEHGTIHRQRRSIDIRRRSESGENAAFEDSSEDPDSLPLSLNSTHKLINPLLDSNGTAAGGRRNVSMSSNSNGDTENSVWKKEHSHHTGILNDSNPYQAIDGSDSESESSFSSSEEALAKCEGVVASLYLKATPSCGTEETVEDIPIFYESIVNGSGYYYFIFGSENEKRDNFIRARFELEKFIYELPEPVSNCTDVKECRVNFTFWSPQKLVVQIPQPSPEKESVWDEVYVAESTCEPRALLYLIFVIIVPVSIILCAFH